MFARFQTPRWLLASVLLHRDARWMGPHAWRGGFLIAQFFALWLMSEVVRGRTAPGLEVLRSLTWVSAGGLAALAVFGVGSLFRDEWVGNNWELLQITGVSGFDLLLAKLFPTWLTAGSLLLLEIPCFLLCVTLGGVTLVQVGAVWWQLLWLFLVASSLTAFTATIFRGLNVIAVNSVLFFLVYCLIVFVLVDLPFKAFAILVLNHPTGVENSPSAASFPLQFSLIFQSKFAGPMINWQTGVHLLSIAGIHRLTGMVLRKKLAASSVDRTVEEAPPEGEAHRTDMPVWRPSTSPPPIRGNAIEWKDYHFTLGGNDMMLGKSIVMAIAFGLFLLGSDDPRLFILPVLAVLGPIGSMVFMANRLWLQEIREQTLGGLILLPISARDIILAKLRAFTWMCVPEMILFAGQLLVIAELSFHYRHWEVCGFFVALLVSLPMVVCTDAAWRLIPQTWATVGRRGALVGMIVGAWFVAGCLAGIRPMLGLIPLFLLMPVVCRQAIQLAANWVDQHAGELID